MTTRRCSRPVVIVGVIGGLIGIVWLLNAREWGTWPMLLELGFSLLMLASVASELAAGWRTYTGYVLIAAGLVSGTNGTAFIVMYLRTVEAFGRMHETLPHGVFIVPIVTSLLFTLYAAGFAAITLAARRGRAEDH